MCAACGRVAAPILIAAPGEPLPERPPPALSLPLDDWRYETEVPQAGGVSTTLGADEAASLIKAIGTGDLEYLRSLGRPIVGAICRTCQAVYCDAHMTVNTIYESGGAPQYDCHFEATCFKGHCRTFERH